MKDGDDLMIKGIIKLVLGLKCLNDPYHNMQIQVNHWTPQPLKMNMNILCLITSSKELH